MVATLLAAENQTGYKPADHCEQGAPRASAECAASAARKRSVYGPDSRKQSHETKGTDGNNRPHNLAVATSAADAHPHNTHEPERAKGCEALEYASIYNRRKR